MAQYVKGVAAAAKASSSSPSQPLATVPSSSVSPNAPVTLQGLVSTSSTPYDPANPDAIEGSIYGGMSRETVRASEDQASAITIESLLSSGELIEQPEPGTQQLLDWMQKSSIIPQCIEAVAVNQGGFGVDMEPTFADPDKPPPGAEEQLERAELFFATVAGRSTLEEVRGNRDRDREGIGNGYLEWLRTVGGDLAGVQHVRAQHIWLCKLSAPVVFERQWMSPRTGTVHTIPRLMRFRKFVKILDMERPVFFKELGDPRYLHKYSGQYSDTPIDLHLQATELSHSLRYCPFSEYGFPVWAYQSPEVRSAREFMELLVRWFEKGGIGLWLVASSNGAIRNQEALQQKLDTLRGSNQAFGMLFADAVAGDASDLVADMGSGKKEANTVSVHELTSALNHDLILKFTASIRPIVRSAWRLPPTYTGEAQEYSHAAVMTSQSVGEEQVFEPLRKQDDAFFNQMILPMIGVHHYRVKTRGASTSDDVETAKAISPYLPMLTYASVAKLIRTLTGIELQVPNEGWVHVPLEILKIRMASGADINTPVTDGDMDSEEVIAKSALKADSFYNHVMDLLRPVG